MLHHNGKKVTDGLTRDDFQRLCALIKSVYPRVEYLDNEDASRVFFNMLNRYDFTDVWKGVRNYLEMERYAPAIADIIRYTEDAERMRKETARRMNAADAFSLAVKCTKCNDAGFLWVTYSDGTEIVRSCDCEKAREENPWAFLDDNAYEDAHEKQRKRGQSPPNGKPGHDSDWWRQQCGEIVSITPGRRLPGKAVGHET